MARFLHQTASIGSIWRKTMQAKTATTDRKAWSDRSKDILPLVGLQFVALAWVVLNQFRFHLNLHAGDHSGLVFKG